MDKNTDKDLWISASRLKTYLSCSYKYWCSYHLKLPKEGSDQTKRGSLVHLLFECVLKKKKRHYVNKVVKDGTIQNCPEIMRFVKWQIEKEGIGEEDNKGINNFELIDQMIVTGFAYDFFCDKEVLKEDIAETLFKYENEDPKYKILGYIDKFSEEEDEDYIVGIAKDYKSSAQAFSEVELDFEVQALMYLLYIKRGMKMDGLMEFIFLRFPEDISRKVSASDETLKGFEIFLGSVYSHMLSFNKEDAVGNMAADMGYPKDGTFSGSLVCGYGKFPNHSYSETHKDKTKRGKPYFVCECAWPMDYYVALDENGSIIKSSKEILDLKDFENIEYRRYEGCPRKINTPEYKEWLENQEEL